MAQVAQSYDSMMSKPNEDDATEAVERARRVQFIIYLLMLAGMALPFLVAWFTGHLGFSTSP